MCDCHEARNLPDAAADIRLAAHQRGEPPLGRHTPHADCVVDHDALVVDHLLDPQIHVGGEAAVELELASADRLAPFRRAQVDERKAHVLLPLVRDIAVECHRRDVRLDDVSRPSCRVEDPRSDSHEVMSAVVGREVLDDGV